MNVVALLSGGKDSCYTLLKTRVHGHNVIAVAHITPPVEEADSFMYQSVASSAIPYLAEALELPLFTYPTKAKAHHQGLAYTPTLDDEVEDLVELLRNVKKAHPSLQAVCAGALWSDYQRLRVESAASRVGLLSLAYLWRRKQSELLDEMIDIGLHAVLVKVAGIGLDSEHLGKSLADMRPVLLKLEDMYGSHVCGEGGEYESLVLWMPGFKKRLVLKEVEVVPHTEDPIAPVSYLRIHECALEDMTDEQNLIVTPAQPVKPQPFCFEPDPSPLAISSNCTAEADDGDRVLEASVGLSENFMHAVIRSPKEGKEGVIEAAQRLEHILKSQSASLACVVYVTLHLRSVKGSKYATANSGYNIVFGTPECTPPPSRACVGTFPENYATTLEAFIRLKRDRSNPDSFTLHVQSLSEWAPPCIGPYAQIVEEDGVVHVCGVLPLYGPTASILKGMPVRKQVEACVHNIEKTLEATRSKLSRLGIFIAYITSPEYVGPVLEELSLRINQDRYITAIIPVSELPKNGQVEIRAVGTLNDEDLHKADCSDPAFNEQGLEQSGIVCGKLAFVSTTYKAIGPSEVDFSKLLVSAISSVPFESSSHPLTIQVYTSLSRHGEMERILSSLLPDTAVVCFASPWLPNDADFVSLTTFAL